MESPLFSQSTERVPEHGALERVPSLDSPASSSIARCDEIIHTLKRARIDRTRSEVDLAPLNRFLWGEEISLLPNRDLIMLVREISLFKEAPTTLIGKL